MAVPIAYTVLFDLKVKQSVYINSIFDAATQVLASKICDYFKILYQDDTHYIGGFSKTQSTATVKVFPGEGVRNVTITMEIPRYIHFFIHSSILICNTAIKQILQPPL